MINYSLPKVIIIGQKEYPINKDGDYRMILDILCALNDDELSENEKKYVILNLFYGFNIPDDIQTAINEIMLFINCGNIINEKDNKPPLMDWEKDYHLIVSPVNKVLGYETRDENKYIHWWTFVSAFMEIDENNQFSTIIKIRQKLFKNKKLDKAEQEYYNANYDLINLKVKFSHEEEEFFQNILGGD